MERYTEYILGLDIAAVISAVLIFFFGNLEAEAVFLLATELIFTLVVLSLSFTFLYFVHLGKNNWLLIPGMVVFAIGALLTFFSWFIGGLIALVSLYIILISKDIDKKETRGISLSYFGLALLSVMPPIGAFFNWQVSMTDYIIILVGIALIFVGIYFSLKTRKFVEITSTGFLLMSLSFLFIAPAHELLGVHANGSYGVYDISIVALASTAFFIFLGNLMYYRWNEKKVYDEIERGYKFLKKGKYEEALKHFKVAYHALPNDERVLNGMGLSLMKLGRYNESEEYLRKLTRLSDDKVYMTNLGNLYFRSGRIDKAMEIYEKVLEKDPHFYNALNNLARCYMEKGDYEKARELLEKAIAEDENKKAAKVNYYFLLSAMGMSEEAGKYKAQLGGLIE